MSDMMAWALHYQSQGLSVIPVQGKVPLIKWAKYQEVKASEEEIKEWWTKWPQADIGCVTGKITQRIVLDIDGDEGVQALSGYAVPPTLAVKTRRGVQYHFRCKEFNSKTTVAGIYPQVDVRGEGGYVKLPPSLCSDGTRYEWINDMNTPLAECPQWLIDKLNEKPVYTEGISGEAKEPWLAEILEGVGVGKQHDSLVKLAGYYFNCFPPEVAIMHLREWDKKNTPPMEKEDFENQLQDLKQRFTSGEYQVKFKEKLPRKLDIITADSLVRNYSRAPQYLVPGLIPQGARTILSGWQGRGKSFAMSDLVIEVARKKGQGRWMGLLPTAKGPVIYIDNENGSNLVSYRMSQLLAPKGLTTQDVDLHFVIGHHFKITSEMDYSWLREKVKEIKPVLVVMDSLASCHSLDENISSSMRIFFDDLIAPFCEEFGTGFLCIDHEKKDTIGLESSGGKRLRGSSAKGDAVDCILSLNEKDGIVFMEHAKSRYAKKHNPIVINIEDVQGGLRVVGKEFAI